MSKKTLTVVAVAFVLGLQCGCRQPIADEAGPRKMVVAYIQAINDGDTRAQIGLFSSEPIPVSIINGRLAKGRDAIQQDRERFLHPDFRSTFGEKLELASMQVETLSDGIVLATADIRLHVEPSHPSGPTDLVMTLVLTNTVDGWKILHQHASSR